MKIIRFVKQYPAVLKSVSHMLICIFAEHSHAVLNTRPSPYSLHTDPILCLKTNQPLCLFSPTIMIYSLQDLHWIKRHANVDICSMHFAIAHAKSFFMTAGVY